ncbi:MAG: hypothetical protein ACREAZ_12385 [Nitrososphaera sp.]
MGSDFIMLAAMLLTFATLGIYEGYTLHPVFYSNAVVILGALGYFTFRYILEKE